MVPKTKDSEVQERAQSRDGARALEELSVSRLAANTTRTSVSAGRSCRVCDAPITGRRRNGFCSDRCRLRASRVAKRARVGEELAEMERKVEMFAVEMRSASNLLRAELLADDGREERDRSTA